MNQKVIISRVKNKRQRYHKTICKWTDNIKHENRRQVKKYEAIILGYTPCIDCQTER